MATRFWLPTSTQHSSIVEPCEWVNDSQMRYHEFLVAAAVLNGAVRVCEYEREDAEPDVAAAPSPEVVMPTRCRCCRRLPAVTARGRLCWRCAAGDCPRGPTHRRRVVDVDGRVRTEPRP